MSKGSGRRPAAISAQEFAEKWAQTFGDYGRPLIEDDLERQSADNAKLAELLDEYRELPRAEANADAPPTTEERRDA